MPDRVSRKLSDALVDGQAEWDAAIAECYDPIEIRATEFSNVRFENLHVRNATFVGCEFDLVTLKDVQFFKSVFTDCTFVRSAFLSAKFLDCQFSGLTLQDSSSRLLSFKGGNLKKTTFSGGGYSVLYIENSLVQDANFSRCHSSSLKIRGSIIELIRLDNMIANSVIIETAKGKSITVANCELETHKLLDSSISDLCIKESEVPDLRIEDSTLYNLEITHNSLSWIDLSRSSIFDADLTTFPIETAVLAKTNFRRCTWPSQLGTTTWYGGFEPAERLLDHPAHEIEGLGPQLSSEISQGQLLAQLSEASKKSLPRRVSFLLWGFLTDYGRSLTRFAVYCLLAISFISALQVVECTPLRQMEALEISSQFVEAWKYKTQVFLGFPTSQNTSACRTSYDFSMRVVGFVSIGLWVGLAANRLGFLSAMNK